MKPSIDLFVFADALGWELARERRFLEDLLPHRSRCDTIFGYSSTCDPSILTGKMPREHGHFSFFVKARDASPFKWARWLGWLPESVAGHHRVRNRISRWVSRKLGYTGYFQLYSVPFSRLHTLDYTEKRDIYQPGGILGGQRTIFDLWRESGVPWVCSDWRRSDAANVEELSAHLSKGDIRLAYLFNAGLDAAMHAHTTHGPEVDAAFAKLEAWIRGLDAVARTRYAEVRWHLFSDHGMTDTKHLSRMMPEFESLGLRHGVDYVAVWDSTMARFWFPGGTGVRRLVEGWLGSRTEGAIVSDAQLEAWECDFQDGRYGELFFLLNEGTIFAPSYMNQRRVPAMHGFSPDLPSSAACWLTSHPVDPKPARIEQIHNVMARACQRVRDGG